VFHHLTLAFPFFSAKFWFRASSVTVWEFQLEALALIRDAGITRAGSLAVLPEDDVADLGVVDELASLGFVDFDESHIAGPPSAIAADVLDRIINGARASTSALQEQHRQLPGVEGLVADSTVCMCAFVNRSLSLLPQLMALFGCGVRADSSTRCCLAISRHDRLRNRSKYSVQVD
jgi:hypothetical protein